MIIDAGGSPAGGGGPRVVFEFVLCLDLSLQRVNVVHRVHEGGTHSVIKDGIATALRRNRALVGQ